MICPHRSRHTYDRLAWIGLPSLSRSTGTRQCTHAVTFGHARSSYPVALVIYASPPSTVVCWPPPDRHPPREPSLAAASTGAAPAAPIPTPPRPSSASTATQVAPEGAGTSVGCGPRPVPAPGSPVIGPCPWQACSHCHAEPPAGTARRCRSSAASGLRTTP